MAVITPTTHERLQWALLAHDAFNARENRIGYTFSAAAAMRDGATMRTEQFDALQSLYREWLIKGASVFAVEAR